jgi:hypothetical protein
MNYSGATGYFKFFLLSRLMDEGFGRSPRWYIFPRKYEGETGKGVKTKTITNVMEKVAV